jgi:HEAT repeat protein
MLLQSLDADVPELRYSACYALGKIGPAAESAVPALHRCLQSSDEFMRFAAVWALVHIEPQNEPVHRRALPLLIKALADSRAHVRAEAAATLGELGSEARAALGHLRGLLVDPSPEVRTAAEVAIRQIGGSPE